MASLNHFKDEIGDSNSSSACHRNRDPCHHRTLLGMYSSEKQLCARTSAFAVATCPLAGTQLWRSFETTPGTIGPRGEDSLTQLSPDTSTGGYREPPTNRKADPKCRRRSGTKSSANTTHERLSQQTCADGHDAKTSTARSQKMSNRDIQFLRVNTRDNTVGTARKHTRKPRTPLGQFLGRASGLRGILLVHARLPPRRTSAPPL